MALVASNSTDELIHSYRSPFSNLSERIAMKYNSRSLQSTDPTPIMINCDTTGPLNISKGSIMCDICGSVIRKTYLMNHRNSGACDRLKEKREQIIPGPQSTYQGPYIHLENDSNESIKSSLNKNNGS
jgi:hypothetical protein